MLADQANGKTPYPHKFHLTTNFPEFIEKYTNKVQLKDGESDQSASVSLAGRVWSIRNSGKLCFMDLHSDGAKLQVMAQADVLTSGPLPFDDLIATVRRGDIIGVTGTAVVIPAARVLLRVAPDADCACRCAVCRHAGAFQAWRTLNPPDFRPTSFALPSHAAHGSHRPQERRDAVSPAVRYTLPSHRRRWPCSRGRAWFGARIWWCAPHR